MIHGAQALGTQGISVADLLGHAQGATATRKTMASSTGSGASTTAGDVGNITGADFLTLLVSELKNQDPTKPTDPQEYVQQLVGVNSLQQLIQINEDLGGNPNKG